jgi:hypothetical protein
MVVMEQRTGAMAIGAIIAAVVSFFFTFTGHPFWGLISAIISVPLGFIGVMMAASPRVGGGMLSIAAIIIGVLAMGVAVLGFIGVVLF